MNHHFKDLRAHVKYALSIASPLRFDPLPSRAQFTVDIYSGASMDNKGDNHGRGRHVIFCWCGEVVHPISWFSHKLRRMACSTSTAEILVSSNAMDKGIYISKLLSRLLYDHRVNFNFDSRLLINLTTSIKEPTEALKKIDLSAMRKHFENGGLYSAAWCPGYYMVADPLTKDNRETAALLQRVLRNVIYPIHASQETRIATKGEM